MTNETPPSVKSTHSLCTFKDGQDSDLGAGLQLKNGHGGDRMGYRNLLTPIVGLIANV
jgi:hypothetical protein